MSDYKSFLSGNLDKYKGVPFWSWNNALDEGELVRQIEEMHSVGIGGFIMHARTGLSDEYLGEKWFSCIGACLKKARELGMSAWCYDENGWPSGFVGGKLLENKDFHAKYLALERGDFDPSAYASFVERPEGYVRVESACADAGEHLNVYIKTNHANTDILDPRVVDAFIELTYEEYYKRFGDSFGRELVGFFTDEPQWYRYATPYSPSVVSAFAAEGLDVRDGLCYLFLHDARGYAFREKYYGVMNRLYCENFYKKIYDWCTAHNCMLTGHSIEEENLFGQMLGCGAVTPSYEYEHIPGIDHLTRRCPNEIGPKQIGSLASQLGKEQVLTESFACCGFDVTPFELKGLGDAQFFHGVSLLCHHLYPYSMADFGKIDHPPVFSPQGGWFEGFKVFNDYFTRLGALVSNTDELYDVAVIHPIHSVWMEYIRTEEAASVEAIEQDFDRLLCRLRRAGITFQLVDEGILARHGGVRDGKLFVGKCEYDKVIVPKMLTMTSATRDVLRKFKGDLFMEGEIPYTDGRPEKVDLRSTVSFDALASSTRYAFSAPDGRTTLTARKSALGEFLFVKNIDTENESRVRMPGLSAAFKILDLTTLKTENASDEFTLPKSGGVILVRDESAAPAVATVTAEDVTERFSVASIGRNSLVLDQAELAREDGVFGKPFYISAQFERLLRDDYKGRLTVRQRFFCESAMPVTFEMERAKLLSLTCNGEALSLSQSAFDINFREAKINAKAGENIIEYSFDYYQCEGVYDVLFHPQATESLRNCLYYDTSIENAYLHGDFTVDEKHVLHKRVALPPRTSELYRNGYPFYNGELVLRGTLAYNGEGRAFMDIDGRFIQAKVRANGKEALFAMDKRGEITEILKMGENDVEIILSSSLRNLFGPYHLIDSEKKPIGRPSFTFQRSWPEDGGLPEGFTPEYLSVPFGADAVKLEICK